MAGTTNISDYRFSIFINNDNAKKALLDLEKTVNSADQALKNLEKQGKGSSDEANSLRAGLKKDRAAMADLTKEAGLNSMSIRELVSLKKMLNNERYNSKPDSEQFNKVGKEIEAVDGRLAELRNRSKETRSSWENMLEVAGGMGLYQIAAQGLNLLVSGISYVKDIMMSTDSTSDKWAETITGLTWGWDTFKKALATGDFTNLISNMEYAIKMGQQYASTLDRIEDRTRALSVTESEERIEFEKLKVIERDATKSKEERIKAAQQALSIEAKLLKEKMSIDTQNFQNEMSNAKTKTGLGEATIKMYFKNFNAQLPLIDQANEYLSLQKKIEDAKNRAGKGGAVDQGALLAIKQYNEELKKIPAEAKAYSSVVKSIGKLSTAEDNNELQKLVDSYVRIGETQQNSIRETSRIKTTMSKLEKGQLDEANNETSRVTSQQYKALEKDAQQHSDYLLNIKKNLEDAMIALVKDEQEKELKQAELLYNRKVAEITGSTSEEIALKKALEEQFLLQKEQINKKYSDKEIAKSWQIEKEKWNAKIQAAAQGEPLWFLYQTEFLDKQQEFELSNTELTEQQKLDIIEKYALKRQGLEQDFTGPQNDGSGSTGDPKKKRKKDPPKWLGDAQDAINYASTALSSLQSVDQAMSGYENAQLQKDVFLNDEKKKNLKRQLDAKLITQQQYDAKVAKLDQEMDNKKKELMVRQAKRQKALTIAQTIISIAQGVVTALATSGNPIIGIIMAALVGALGAVQLGYIISTPIPEAAKGRYKAFLQTRQAADGRYDVLGQDDGKQYRGVPYMESPQSGIYSKPTLFAETGREIILNPKHTENLMKFRPDLVQAIMSVPQRAAGLYPDAGAQRQASQQQVVVKWDQETLDEFKLFREQLKKPIRSSILYDEMTESMNTVSMIEANVTR